MIKRNNQVNFHRWVCKRGRASLRYCWQYNQLSECRTRSFYPHAAALSPTSSNVYRNESTAQLQYSSPPWKIHSNFSPCKKTNPQDRSPCSAAPNSSNTEIVCTKYHSHTFNYFPLLWTSAREYKDCLGRNLSQSVSL